MAAPMEDIAERRGGRVRPPDVGPAGFAGDLVADFVGHRGMFGERRSEVGQGSFGVSFVTRENFGNHVCAFETDGELASCTGVVGTGKNGDNGLSMAVAVKLNVPWLRGLCSLTYFTSSEVR